MVKRGWELLQFKGVICQNIVFEHVFRNTILVRKASGIHGVAVTGGWTRQLVWSWPHVTAGHDMPISYLEGRGVKLGFGLCISLGTRVCILGITTILWFSLTRHYSYSFG